MHFDEMKGRIGRDPWKAHKLTSTSTKALECMVVGQVRGHATQHPSVDGAACWMLVHVQLQSFFFAYLHPDND
jgi:hypothetical protein